MLIFEWDPGVDGSRMDLYHYDRIGGRWNHKEELESRVLEGKDGFDGVQTRRGLQWIEIFTRSEEEMLISEYQLRDLRGISKLFWNIRRFDYETMRLLVFGELKMDYGRSVQMGSLVSSNRRLPYQVLVGIGMGVKQWVIGYKGFSGIGYGAQKCVLDI
ncbi:hypothetical protein YC2023_023502 [Brassica napus]